MRNESPAALLQCSCGGRPRIVTRDVEPQNDPWYGKKMETFVLCECGMCLFDGAFHEGFSSEASACEAWNRRASTVPAASESRGSVPDGVTHNERVLCEAIVRHQFQDKHRDGRLTIDVETLLHEYNQHKVDAPTPPAVASGEPTADLPSRFFYEAALEIAHKHASMSRDEFHKACEQRARELAEQARAGKGEG